MGNGRLEALITNSVNWTGSVNDGGGADTFTVTAGSRYPTDFLAALETALEAATGSGWTVTWSDGEAGTGIVTIAINSGSASVTWTSTDMRDLLGYTGNLSSAASHVGARGMQGAYFPGCPLASESEDFDPDTQGNLVTDATHYRGPTGAVTRWVGNSYRCFKRVIWSHVTRDRAIDGASATQVSWQQFVRQSQYGGLGYFPITSAGVPPKVKVYFNADTDTVVGAANSGDGIYYLILPPGLALMRPSGWANLLTVEIPEMVKV
jgi:hypothetical protein